MSEQQLIRVVVIDDHRLVIEGLKALLGGDAQLEITASFTTGQAALTFLETQPVEVVLLDVNLPDIHGVEMCRLIHERYPTIKVLGLSTYCEPSIINQMIKHGVSGYLLKNVVADELTRAIRQIHSGQYYFGAEIQKILADAVFNHETPRLTRREKEIVRLIADGRTTNQIAEALFISPLTVETHRKNVMKKLKVTNAASLIKLAVEKTII
ncbi:MAG: response regulator transcription factor [Tunicatimonas sp.]